jgi:hypothetical protein
LLKSNQISKKQNMKGRYIHTKILLACLSTTSVNMKNIHIELRETIAEHRRIIKRLTEILLAAEIDEVITQDKKAA